ncbi:MAG: hypothetical protein KAJ19_17300 [Gammaproteobacteria bacterium]|nr:hypothetical protein [Gammaproteobacteria bacterium]
MIDLIRNYYKVRGLKWPTIEQAMMWVETELGETYELLLSRDGDWVRNHPWNKTMFSSGALAEELGDAIMMLIVAGIVEGVDPLAALREKIERKIRDE